MRYLGGKSKVGRQIAEAVARDSQRRVFWDAFCGGLSVSYALLKYGTVVSTDVHPALIALYKGIRAGWTPPESVSREAYLAARDLPDTDPMKGFCGFPCSFAGKWFGGYAAERRSREYVKKGEPPRLLVEDPVQAASKALARVVELYCVDCIDFLQVVPEKAHNIAIYCDPPYAQKTGYSTGKFDHLTFWSLVDRWERLGVPVYVSEYTCPVPHRVVWSAESVRGLRDKSGAQKHTERLFRLR